jgi:hypothetical protein
VKSQELYAGRGPQGQLPPAWPSIGNETAIAHLDRKYPGHVRQTEFWGRMRSQFGDAYAESVAKDFVFANLGDRTVERALADGIDAKKVWRSVCDQFNVPENLR